MAHFLPTMDGKNRRILSGWGRHLHFINLVAAFTVVIRKSGADSGDCTNMHSLIARDFPIYDVGSIRLHISCPGRYRTR